MVLSSATLSSQIVIFPLGKNRQTNSRRFDIVFLSKNRDKEFIHVMFWCTGLTAYLLWVVYF